MLKSKLLLISALAGFFLVLAAGCEYDEIPLPAEPDPGVVYSFSKDILPIFNQACNTAGCHTTGGNKPDLSPGNAYQSLIAGKYVDTAAPESSSLYLWMKGSKSIPMPLTGPNPGWNALVLNWITQGAKDN
jgi:hypothetical protein